VDTAEILDKYFPDLSQHQKNQFLQLGHLFEKWNQQINLVSRKDIDSLYEKHVLHSLAIAKLIQFQPGTKIMDVGTGGGLPGIPLAIMFPETQFYLIDSIGKKIKVVKDLSKQLKLGNLETEHIRAEKVTEKFDFIVSRAVTRLSSFYGWTKKNILAESFNTIKNGMLFLKGGNLSQEINELHKKTVIIEIKDYFEEYFYETKKIVYLKN